MSRFYKNHLIHLHYLTGYVIPKIVVKLEMISKCKVSGSVKGWILSSRLVDANYHI